MSFSFKIGGGHALGIVLGMAALAIMLVAGGVPHRSSSRSRFPLYGHSGVHSATNLSLNAYLIPGAAIARPCGRMESKTRQESIFRQDEQD